MTASNAAELYAQISADHDLTQALFRQALQDPSGAISRIIELGQQFGLPRLRNSLKRKFFMRQVKHQMQVVLQLLVWKCRKTHCV